MAPFDNVPQCPPGVESAIDLRLDCHAFPAACHEDAEPAPALVVGAWLVVLQVELLTVESAFCTLGLLPVTVDLRLTVSLPHGVCVSGNCVSILRVWNSRAGGIPWLLSNTPGAQKLSHCAVSRETVEIYSARWHQQCRCSYLVGIQNFCTL
ncbi:hypothetical protein CEXT_711551 [Caerostris extrusa]|uniref:Uncharacterized protein n=1 Tax=Caerostris extrusa TaxID=172846 RepID=A0AAV4N701_CAEEX|nr:hypothetical protein CEXT_711551 [Caerostris extrusa]